MPLTMAPLKPRLVTARSSSSAAARGLAVGTTAKAEKRSGCGRGSGIDPLAAAGVPVWIDDRARMAHAKTMVIDGAVTLQGSYNWTRGAAANSEDLNLISSPAIRLRSKAERAHWPRNILYRLLAKIIESDWQLVADLIADCPEDAEAARSHRASRRAATLTPSPKMSFASMMMSPTLAENASTRPSPPVGDASSNQPETAS